ncbi:class I SAM-dependent methyltransferase [Lysobacter solisilvae (ex Woo and Kim 2020)]|uniref:Class I SAM-dependent methyltransferase n=1 Tax=Agrilutibacter terrestris TaxID=2865112 RepID=A0A7H0G0Z1_9GAMM|nr:class I SAM-dependent methyltransferase [Lysobacter terrestris]QNP41957.1 class I SAM-dependent methyltransferase [Lysobacter terrestris]
MNRLLPSVVLLSAALAACTTTAPPAATDGASAQASATVAADLPALDAALAGRWRDAKNSARDGYRHPRETLAFFGVGPAQTVVEITPGGGWYAEVLAPYLRARGHYVAAVWDDAIPGQPGYRYGLNKALRAKFAADPAVYGTPDVRVFDPAAPVFGAPGSADVVLTFRNAHNWVADGNADAYFQAFFTVLKPGGTLGVVDHRAKAGTDLATMKESGYLTEALVIEHATRAGFVLEAQSGINANPKDTTEHPNGVWTLPPVNRHDAADDAKYQAIGESDRMTLRFRKPR